MRWIFYSLIVVNILAFVWGVFLTPSSEASISKSKVKTYDGVESLVMVKEFRLQQQSLNDQNSNAEEQKPDPETDLITGKYSVATLNSSAKTLCEMVGPFEDSLAAEVFLERLTAIDIAAKVKALDLPAGERYQVFLPAESTRKDALRRLAELQANKIDSYVINRGPLANSISLGLFTKKSFALAHVESMKKLGLTPKIDVIEDKVREIWVVLAQGEGAKMNNLTWNRVMEDLKELERRQNFCLDVASEDNFH